jgi:hypothetical protein
MLTTELHAGDGRRWIAAGVARGDSAIGDARCNASSLGALAGDSAEVVLFLEGSLCAAFDESLTSLWNDVPEKESTFMVLVPRDDAPQIDPAFGEPVTSFLCSASLWKQYLALDVDCWPQTILFAFLRAIAYAAIHVDRLLVRQIPERKVPTPSHDSIPKALLMPHRGDARHLRAALYSISQAAGNSLSVRVGLDVDDTSEHSGLASAHPGVKFFHASPAPVGPYVIRQELAERSAEPLICFQDSDDLSCYDRFATLSGALVETGCGIVGSQELCLDEIRAMVYPVRYPIDSSAALATRSNHVLLHATLMATRNAFFECGGLSTNLMIASDSQFTLRAFFKTSIRNVDEFLYIRRRHAASLTNAPETAHGNPFRCALGDRWNADFEAVKNGKLKLENSSLRRMKRSEPFRMERFRGTGL